MKKQQCCRDVYWSQRANQLAHPILPHNITVYLKKKIQLSVTDDLLPHIILGHNFPFWMHFTNYTKQSKTLVHMCVLSSGDECVNVRLEAALRPNCVHLVFLCFSSSLIRTMSSWSNFDFLLATHWAPVIAAYVVWCYEKVLLFKECINTGSHRVGYCFHTAIYWIKIYRHTLSVVSKQLFFPLTDWGKAPALASQCWFSLQAAIIVIFISTMDQMTTCIWKGAARSDEPTEKLPPNSAVSYLSHCFSF